MLGPIAFWLLASSSPALANNCKVVDPTPELTVWTRTGGFVGDLNDTYPDVRQFKYVPYAKPLVGDLRWVSPQRLDDSSELIDSTNYGPACPQWVSKNPSPYNNVTGIRINPPGNLRQDPQAGSFAWGSDEDCLSLGIWTPASAQSGANLPVVIFLTGGGDSSGGINIKAQLPVNWVHRSQQHIAVTTNYRVNIFGFPNTPKLPSTNLGFQDARAAVEWVHENIEAFGGDPSRITLWGQSAGAISADIYQFAYPDDPIVSAHASSSGFAIPDIGQGISYDFQGTNFSFISNLVGCGGYCDWDKELECMRRIPWPTFTTLIGSYSDNGTQPPLSFVHQADGKYVFTRDEYTERYANGQISKIPKLLGTCAREASIFSKNPPETYEDDVLARTVSIVCAAHNTTVARQNLGLKSWRYQYAGNWTNTSGGIPRLGAYHVSDLWSWFGTYLTLPGDITDLQSQTSETMQDMYLAFLQDPESLTSKGWPAYDVWAEDGGKIARFGADGQAVQFVSGDEIDGVCHIPGATYNTWP